MTPGGSLYCSKHTDIKIAEWSINSGWNKPCPKCADEAAILRLGGNVPRVAHDLDWYIQMIAENEAKIKDLEQKLADCKEAQENAD